MNEVQIAYYTCECYHHALQVSQWNWDDGEPEHTSFGMMLSPGHDNTFRERLRVAWKYLRGGDSTVHEALLSPDEARRLAERIIDEVGERA